MRGRPEERQIVLAHLGDGKIERAAKTTGDDGELNYQRTQGWRV